MSLLAENTKRAARVVVKPAFAKAAVKRAASMLGHKAQYQRIAEEIMQRHQLHVPWWAIPLVHERECVRGVDNWDCNIAQGELYNIKSRIIPHSGPFVSFNAAAMDALVVQAPQLAKWNNWSLGGVATINEMYNGTGYAKRGLPSPYVWSGTNIYVKGKYVRDGKYDPNAIDTQIGVIVTLKALMQLDPTIVLEVELPGQDTVNRTKEVAHATTGGGVIAEASHQALINGVDDWIVYTIAGVAAVVLIIWVYHIVKKKMSEV